MAKPPKKTKADKPASRELEQQCVLTLRPEDQFMVVQNGQQKLMLVSAFADAIKQIIVDTFTSMWGTLAVSAHTHPESDIIGLTDDLNALATALDGKAPTNHAHEIGDVHSNFVDATVTPPVVYNGAYPCTAKATVVNGNAVFQFTKNNLPAGAAIFAGGPLPNSEVFRAEEGTNPHAFGAAVWSNGNKTLTVPVNKTGAAIAVALLGLTLLGQNVVANGSVVYATVWGR